jgi:group I intron endonuclease
MIYVVCSQMSREMAYIYTLSDPETGFVRYVGKSFNIKQRLYYHIYDADKSNTRKNAWVRSLTNRGLTPTIEVIEELPNSCVEEWGEAEKFWIASLKAMGCKLTNSDDGGLLGRRPSEETRKKIGEYSKRRIHSPETRAKIAASCKARMTDEEKEHLRKKSTGLKHTEETKRRIAAAKSGIPRPPHVRAAFLAASLEWKRKQGFKMRPSY